MWNVISFSELERNGLSLDDQVLPNTKVIKLFFNLMLETRVYSAKVCKSSYNMLTPFELI